MAEDKQYYASNEDIYGDQVEVVVQDEDTQPIDKPIIEPIRQKKFMLVEPSMPRTTFDMRFLAGLMDYPKFSRLVSVVGTLHHGKTSLIDILVDATHPSNLSHLGLSAEAKAEDIGETAENSSSSSSSSSRHGGLSTNKKRGETGRLADVAKASSGVDGKGTGEGGRLYMDSRQDERSRQISIKTKPISLVVDDLKNKSHLINLMDTPGHLNFGGEVAAAMRLSDGVLLCVDAVEGVCLGTERLITEAVRERQFIVLAITKIDRLILEMRIPPKDAYFKLQHIVAEVNGVLAKIGSTQRMDPVKGNVLFACAKHSWAFSVPSFAMAYAEHHPEVPADKLAKRLWGNIYLTSDRRFTTKAEDIGQPRTFVQFILEPLYKIYAHSIGADGANVGGLCEEIGVSITKTELLLDIKQLLHIILSRFFSNSAQVIADALVTHITSPISSASEKVRCIYSGDMTDSILRGMNECDPKAPVMVDIAKSYARPDLTTFDSFGRVYSGTLRVGDKVRVLGPRYTVDDEEDLSVREVTRLWVMQGGRYKVEVNRVTAGNWALIEGLDAGIEKTATVTSLIGAENASIFLPLTLPVAAHVKVALEPVVPSELPKVVHGLRRLVKCYPAALTKVEESGEHVLMGCGELDLDCMLHDLRRLYTDVEVKVADPTVRLSETVSETSSVKCFAETPNKANVFTLIAEPLDTAIVDDIEAGVLAKSYMPAPAVEAAFSAAVSSASSSSASSSSSSSSSLPSLTERIATFFEGRYGWDPLAARSVWAFGPDPSTGPNILCDATLPSEVDRSLLSEVKEPLIEGFRWAVQDGPLCDEPVRSVKFRLLDAKISTDRQQRTLRPMLATARRLTYSSFLLASPRLLEPIQLVDITCPLDCLPVARTILSTRRGHVVKEQEKAGTPLYTMQAYIPLLDSFGFETDLRARTFGMAYCMLTFDHWGVVPGDPLDKSIVLKPLEISKPHQLARELMVKTRRRKGLGEDVSINRYFDDAMLLELAKQAQQMDESM